VIPEALAGKRIAITGSTGFLGTALVERLLRAVPGCELVLIVRSGRRTTPAARAKREIFGNDAFKTLRAQLGGAFDAEIARRVQVVAGDVSIDGLGLEGVPGAQADVCDLTGGGSSGLVRAAVWRRTRAPSYSRRNTSRCPP